MRISEPDQINHMTNMYTASQHPYRYLFSRHQKPTTTSLSRQLISGAGPPIHRTPEICTDWRQSLAYLGLRSKQPRTKRTGSITPY